MKRGYPWLNFTPPKMQHGDADRMIEFCERTDIALLPWQRELLNRLESASMFEQFKDIIRKSWR